MQGKGEGFVLGKPSCGVESSELLRHRKMHPQQQCLLGVLEKLPDHPQDLGSPQLAGRNKPTHIGKLILLSCSESDDEAGARL